MNAQTRHVERALHERLVAHGLGAAAGPLAAFGGPLAPLARLPLADPRYMKLAQLRGELALQGRAGGGGVPSGLHGLLAGPHPHPPAGAHPHPAAPSEMPLYPWLMSRHGRVFPGRYAPGESQMLCHVSLSRPPYRRQTGRRHSVCRHPRPLALSRR